MSCGQILWLVKAQSFNTVQPPSRWGGNRAQEAGDGVRSPLATGHSDSSSLPLLLLDLSLLRLLSPEVELLLISPPLHLSLLWLLSSLLHPLLSLLRLLFLLLSLLQLLLLSLLRLLLLSLLLLLSSRFFNQSFSLLLLLLLSSPLCSWLALLWLLSPSAPRLYQDSKSSFTVGARFLSFSLSLSLSSFQLLLLLSLSSLSSLSRSLSPLQLLQECM